MAVQSNSEECRMLRKLVPLVTFPSEAFKALCGNITVEKIQNEVIFKKGDTNTDLVYLLDGSVTLQAEGLVVEVITSESESAKFALAHQIPRKIDAVANGAVRVVRLDAHVVNNPPPAVYQQDQGYTIIEESSEDSDDWMTALLSLPLFQSLPPTNLQKILISLKTAQYYEGDVIIADGSAVDYFYIIKKGQCLLTRKLLDIESEIKLGAGESFGEEYLITGKLTQEKITALSDVSLIQLEKKHFLTQIMNPTLTFISHEEMPEALENNAVLLDVRQQSNYENNNYDGSANIPLLSLRARMEEVPREKQVIVVCADGKSSEAGAFLLQKCRRNGTVLKGGMGIIETEEEENTGVENKQQDDLEVGSPSAEISGHHFDAEMVILKAENLRLLQLVSELEVKNANLQSEKTQYESQCQVLSQQIERLKEILGRFTRRQ